jgi:thymidylate synthase ThyX
MNSAAQPEIAELAATMKVALNSSVPEEIAEGAWHLPFITQEEKDACMESSPNIDWMYANLILASAGRGARVSYKNHDGSNPILEKDIELAERLLESKHLSPFEHQATPIGGPAMGFDGEKLEWHQEIGVTHKDWKGNLWSNNFRGWKQNRALLLEVDFIFDDE